MELEGEFAAYNPPLPTHTHLALLPSIVLSAFLFHIFFPYTAIGTCHSTPYNDPKKSIPIIEPHFQHFPKYFVSRPTFKFCSKNEFPLFLPFNKIVSAGFYICERAWGGERGELYI